ncbi:hypothetical protein MMC17_004540 [Xylographa soralifera]|nr:hypothetical protein [Xylographa soralifera]
MPPGKKENLPFLNPSNTSFPKICLVNNGWRINEPAPTTSTVSPPPNLMPSPSQSSSSFPIDDRPHPPSLTKTPPLEIKILLWNTWLLPSLLTDRRSHARALAISPLLNAYDIVVLNEAFSYKNTLLSQTTHPYRYHPPRPTGRVVDSGLLFLSRYEIVDSGWERYTHVAGVDRFAAKGVGFIAVRVDGWEGRLQVFGTHMQAGASRGVQVARMAQAGQAGAFVKRVRGKEGVVVFSGDFNMGPRGDEEWREFSVHYVDREDAKARCEAYERLVREARVREVECDQGEEYRGDICRFLVGGLEGKGDGVARYEDLKGGDGARLSDTKPICLTLRLDGDCEDVKDAG